MSGYITGTWKSEQVGLQEEKTTEEQLPFDEKKVKECTLVNANIEGNSGEIGQHVGTNSNKHGEETKELRSFEWILG